MILPWRDLCDVNVTVEPVEVWKPEGNPFDLGEAVCLVCFLFLAHLLQPFPSGNTRADTRDLLGLPCKLRCNYNWLYYMNRLSCSSNVSKWLASRRSVFVLTHLSSSLDSSPRIPGVQGDPSRFTHTSEFLHHMHSSVWCWPLVTRAIKYWTLQRDTNEFLDKWNIFF